jgi:hypothetical protein
MRKLQYVAQVESQSCEKPQALLLTEPATLLGP